MNPYGAPGIYTFNEICNSPSQRRLAGGLGGERKTREAKERERNARRLYEQILFFFFLFITLKRLKRVY